MTRRHQQKQKELKRAAKTADIPTQLGTYQRPDRSECFSRQWHIAYDNSQTVRIQFNLWKQGPSIVDFAIIIQRLGTDGWEEAERFDCCHGHCHLHAEGGDNIESIHRLDNVTDVKPAFELASAEAHERARIIRDKGA